MTKERELDPVKLRAAEEVEAGVPVCTFIRLDECDHCGDDIEHRRPTCVYGRLLDGEKDGVEPKPGERWGIWTAPDNKVGVSHTFYMRVKHRHACYVCATEAEAEKMAEDGTERLMQAGHKIPKGVH